jgi:broad specificity phosphatase PhoE
MSSLTLVRHAQASFFADQYDQLSTLGEKQARLLGEYWVRNQPHIDEVYVGPRQRHVQTAQAVAAVFRQAQLQFSEPVVLAELDEYDLGSILGSLAPQLARKNQDFARLLELRHAGASESEKARSFQRMFESLMLYWQTARQTPAGVESWPAFRTRVQRGLNKMMESAGRGRRVVACTSGGFIGTAVQLVLGAPDRAALELNWRIRNTALTEFLFNRERVSLDAFNATVHLPEPSTVTYR